MLIYPTILVGGSGTRLWPLSRGERPKQFLSLVSEQSMLEDTIARVSGDARFFDPIFVSGAQHGALLQTILDDLNLRSSAILLEPEGRNTAAAIAMAAHWIVRQDPDALMLVMPSDHVIANPGHFLAKVDHAVGAAQAGHLVTFGVQPDHPATGYGYIESGGALPGMSGIFDVREFVEKPPLAVAEHYLAQGRHSWNAGIFLFRPKAFLDELMQHAPDVALPITAAMEASAVDGHAVRPHAQSFLDSANISIDCAVMEKTDRAVVVPVDIGWSDVGSWDALWTVRDKDAQGNAVRGDVSTVDCNGNLILVDGGAPVAALGMTDCVIISTAEGVLVMPRGRSQDVKKLHETRAARSDMSMAVAAAIQKADGDRV